MVEKIVVVVVVAVGVVAVGVVAVGVVAAQGVTPGEGPSVNPYQIITPVHTVMALSLC